MLNWALVCYVASIIFAVVGFGGMVESIAFGARLGFFVFVIGFIVALIVGLIHPRRKA